MSASGGFNGSDIFFLHLLVLRDRFKQKLSETKKHTANGILRPEALASSEPYK